MNAFRVIGRAPMQTVRAKALADIYAYPNQALQDLERRGAVHKLAYGYYCLTPPEENPQTWMPDLETAAAGIATAIWGENVPVLMGQSAARIHGTLPRALGEAVVAVPSRHDPVPMTDREATVRFVIRDVEAIDAVRVRTELGPALATTPAQTALDLAREPRILQMPDLVSTLTAVLALTSVEEVAEVAATQGRTKKALDRVLKVARS